MDKKRTGGLLCRVNGLGPEIDMDELDTSIYIDMDELDTFDSMVECI